jgi:hypothetical protein
VLGRHGGMEMISHLEIGDEITTHGKCEQPLQSVELS